jgi:hypothetical protein
MCEVPNAMNAIEDPRETATEAGSAEVPSYVQTCHLCKKEIPAQMVQQGGLHMHCHNQEIDVWFVSLPDAPKHGYYENDVREVAAMLESAEDAYLIERQVMIAGRYFNLKEFEGF